MSDTFPNGVYGINLSQHLIGPSTADLALLSELTKTFEEIDEQDGGKPGVCVGADVYKLFYQRLENVLGKKGINLPPLEEEPVFRLHQVDSHAEINDNEGFDPGDLLLGVGILGFPNDIKFPATFKRDAAWHLWTIDG